MKQRIHREGLLFQWITKDHEIIMGFKRVRHGICESCGRMIPQGDTLCDTCFREKKKMSKK